MAQEHTPRQLGDTGSSINCLRVRVRVRVWVRVRVRGRGRGRVRGRGKVGFYQGGWWVWDAHRPTAGRPLAETPCCWQQPSATALGG